MKRILSIIILLLTMTGYVSAQETFTYDFNSLSIGNLNGQDGWISVKHSAGGGHNVVDEVGPSGWVTPDETLGVFFNNANTNYGEVATHKYAENFPIDFSLGGTYQIEMDMARNWWGTLFGVGYDADGNGVILPPMSYETTQPNPNLQVEDGGIYFVTTGSSTNPKFINGIVLPDNTLPVDFDYNSDNAWTRWRILLDLDANYGAGSVALFADWSCSGNNFEPIAEIQGLNIGLTPGSGDRFDPAAWDGFFFLSSSHGGWDNIKITHIPSGLASQFIDFTAIPNKLTIDEPFQITATSTSGLPVSFELISGPASLNGNVVTLTGEEGTVSIRATQNGDDNWQAAPPVTRSFNVYDPALYAPTITIRRPYNGTDVYLANLEPMFVVASVDVDHDDVIKVQQIEFSVNGETVYGAGHGTNYYTAIWEPSEYGQTNMTVTVTLSGNHNYSTENSFYITNNISSYNVTTFDGTIQVSPTNQVIYGEFIFPSSVGSYNSVSGHLEMNCAPPSGCDPYDRVANLKIKNVDGNWIELFRYITPFGIACSDNIDLSDYLNVLQGLVEFRFEVVCWDGSGYLPVLNFNFNPGTPDYKYIDISEIWCQVFDFGDFSQLQPVPTAYIDINPHAQKVNLKMTTTGHNWSSNTAPNYSVNTDNAAEFYEGTHLIKINGADKFTQHLWPESGSCYPNPAGCNNQQGTYLYPRQGWCPGSIAMVWNWDLSEYIGSPFTIDYIFDPSYTDFCHPNYPECVDGQNGCPNCDAPDNPILNVAAKVLTYSNNVNVFDGATSHLNENRYGITIHPNPSSGIFKISSCKQEPMNVTIVSITGRTIKDFKWYGDEKTINLSDLQKGTYIFKASGKNGVEIKKLVIM